MFISSHIECEKGNFLDTNYSVLVYTMCRKTLKIPTCVFINGTWCSTMTSDLRTEITYFIVKRQGIRQNRFFSRLCAEKTLHYQTYLSWSQMIYPDNARHCHRTMENLKNPKHRYAFFFFLTDVVMYYTTRFSVRSLVGRKDARRTHSPSSSPRRGRFFSPDNQTRCESPVFPSNRLLGDFRVKLDRRRNSEYVRTPESTIRSG